MKKLDAFLSAFFAAGVLMSAIANGEDPRISVTVLNPIEGVPTPPSAIAVSNVRRIEIEVTLDKRSNTSLKQLSDSPVNPSPDNIPTNYFMVKVSDQTTGGALTVKTAMFGTGVKDGAESIRLTLEVPEEPAVRTNKVQSFINRIKADDLASGAATQAQIDKLTAQNALAVTALKKRYMENRVGQFRIVVEYHSTQPGAWNGQVASAPLAVEIQNKGSFFDGL